RDALIDIERLLPRPTGARDRNLKGAERIVRGDAFRRRLALGPFELEVGDHAELLEAREVDGVNKLQMRHLVAVVLVAIRRAGCGKSIEARPYGAVPNGMDVHRDSGCVELGDKARETL